MATWVSQQSVSSWTERTSARTEYLEPLRAQTLDAIRAYLEVDPRSPRMQLRAGAGDEVTLAVFDRVGIAALRRLAKEQGRSFDTVKQDLGLFVVQVLVDRYGADNVQTFRGPDGKTVSTHRVSEGRWPRLKEVAKFTPHRVVVPPERIALDTSIVRPIVAEQSGAMDVDELSASKGERLISIADGALAELVWWIQEVTGKKAAFPRWGANVAKLDKVLDPEMPLLPGGHELTAMAGLAAFQPGYSAPETRAYLRAAWAHLRAAKTYEDLLRSKVYPRADGKRFTLDFRAAAPLLGARASRWEQFILRMADLLRPQAGASPPEEERIVEATRISLVRGHDVRSEKVGTLDLPILALARRVFQAARGEYVPEPGKSNDPMDYELLFALPLVTVVCTNDGALVDFVRAIGHPDARRVLRPAELLVWLRTGELPTIAPSGSR